MPQQKQHDDDNQCTESLDKLHRSKERDHTERPLPEPTCRNIDSVSVAFCGIIPPNPLACLAIIRRKRSHGKLVLAGSATEMRAKTSPLFEIAGVLVRFDHVASFIVNANHRIM